MKAGLKIFGLTTLAKVTVVTVVIAEEVCLGKVINFLTGQRGLIMF